MNKALEISFFEHYNLCFRRAIRNSLICICVFLFLVGLFLWFKQSWPYILFCILIIPLADWVSVVYLKMKIRQKWYDREEEGAQEYLDYLTGKKKMCLFYRVIIKVFSVGAGLTFVGYFYYHSFASVLVGALVMLSCPFMIMIESSVKRCLSVKKRIKS